MNYKDWKSEAVRLLAKLKEKDLGYPLGENVVRMPASCGSTITDIARATNPTVAKKLAPFFEICDGLSWPDVHCGYFVNRRKEIGQVKNDYYPTKIKGNGETPIYVIGSSGTGALFALCAKTGSILVLPVGHIEKNTYYDTDDKIRVIASNFDNFALNLLVDFTAFIEGVPGHEYVA